LAIRRSRIRAPELSGSGGWLNTDAPLSMASLRGKVVLLDFWTYCCVNCLRLLEELRPLEEKWGDELVVVGVHSPKFPREADQAALRAALVRHRVTHPVLDDPELVTWDQYAVKGWPTVVLVDPEGYVVGAASGEGCGPVLDDAVADVVARASAAGTLVRGRRRGPASAPPAGPLAFPGKVAVDPGGERIAVSDTGHDRVLVAYPDGLAVAEVTGLTQPQGVRFTGRGLIICDTGADRVVEVELSEEGAGPLTTVVDGLASPWDVVVEPSGAAVVAEAGRHRLWRVPGGPRPAEPVAGNGREGLADGPATEAELAQPSGLCLDRGGIVFADAESSALRLLSAEGRVTTIVGEGLFDWGHDDGPPAQARLQHPLGVAARGATVFVADTFNSRLRVWDGSQLATIPVGDGTLDEPGGLDVTPEGRLLVADTNHHRVVTVDPATGRVEPLPIDLSGLDARPAAGVTARRGSTFTLDLTISLDGRALDDSAGPPVRAAVEARPPHLLAPGARQWALDDVCRLVQLTGGARPDTGTLLVEVSAAVCGDGTCEVITRRRRHRLTIT